MPSPREHNRYLDCAVLVAVFTAFVFLPPFVYLWAGASFPWYLPYVIWLVVIFLIGIVQSMRDRHEL